jgi:arylsulfatase
LLPGGERSYAGPFDRWPLGVGFDHYYGFLGGDANHWSPHLVRDNQYVRPPRTPEEGYHLTEDLVDHAIEYVTRQHQAAPDRPFFLYLAFGAMHAPHHVSPEWIDPYRGAFDQGWERWREAVFARQLDDGIVPPSTSLGARPSWVPAWDSFSTDGQRMLARQHEVFAGFLTHSDAQIGLLMAALEELALLDDTVVMLLSDNGASGEGGVLGTFNEHRFSSHLPETIEGNARWSEELGGVRTYPHYSWGWAWAGNTPLRLWKRYTWLGGTRTPLIVHWPNGIRARGEIRSQLVHAIDLMPTVFDLCGVDPPPEVDGEPQQRIDGTTIRATFDDADAPDPRTVQYFEMLGSRSIIADGWKATTDHVSKGVLDEEARLVGSREFADDRWALFRMADDFSEEHDLAQQFPDVVAALQERWAAEAEANHVLPLIDDLIGRVSSLITSPNPPPTRGVFRPAGGPVPDASLPRLYAGFSIAADVDVPEHGAEGVLWAIGDWTGGCALFVRDGRLVFCLNRAGDPAKVVSTHTIETGRHTLTCVYSSETSAPTLTLLQDNAVLGWSELPINVPMTWQHGGTMLNLGYDDGLRVSEDYDMPFRWTGALHEVVVQATREAIPRPPEEVESALHHE